MTFNSHRLFAAIAISVALLHTASAAKHRVVFNRIGPTRLGLYIAGPDGRNEKPLLPPDGLDYNASFSADGQWVVFTSERSGSADIYRIHPDGSGLQRLTDDPAFDDQAALSPDGSKLAFVSTRGGGRARIWILDIPTRRCRLLTNQSGGEFRPAWSPDGSWIAYTSDRETKAGRVSPNFELLQSGGFEFLQSTDLYLIHSDGSGGRRLTEPGRIRRQSEVVAGRTPDRILCREC
jgi:Tol biopolymer transport system component